MDLYRRFAEEGAKTLNKAMAKLEKQAAEVHRQQGPGVSNVPNNMYNIPSYYHGYQTNHGLVHANAPPLVPNNAYATPNYDHSYQPNHGPVHANAPPLGSNNAYATPNYDHSYQTNHGDVHANLPPIAPNNTYGIPNYDHIYQTPHYGPGSFVAPPPPVPTNNFDRGNLDDIMRTGMSLLEQCKKDERLPKIDDEDEARRRRFMNSDESGGHGAGSSSTEEDLEEIARAQHLSNMRVELADAQSRHSLERVDKFGPIEYERRYVYSERKKMGFGDV